MAANNSVLRSLRPKPCAADGLRKPRGPQAAAAKPPTWELHIGHIKLAIIGPSDHQWFSITGPYYGRRVGTDAERELGARAVAILNAEHADDISIGRPEVEAILKRAGNE